MTVTREDLREFTEKYSKICKSNDSIDKQLFAEYGVKRGLRDLNGKGVLTGITNISRVESTKMVNGESVPCEGKLYFRGYKIQDLVQGFMKEGAVFLCRSFQQLFIGKVPGSAPHQQHINRR